jgi:anti-anti-sigma factor
MNTSHALEDELRRVEAGDAKQILVDLGGLNSIGADGLKIFIHANARSRRAGSRLLLLCASGRVQRTFETTGLLSRLPLTIVADAPHGERQGEPRPAARGEPVLPRAKRTRCSRPL